MSSLILAIPDAHVEPEQSLERFEWLSRLIADRKPTHIVQLGDFLSMGSLSHWDHNKRLLMEGRRYAADIKAGKTALNTLYSDLFNLQRKQRELKTKIYNPQTIWMFGNHEHWVTQYVEQHPEMLGMLNIENDLQLHQIPNITVTQYKEIYEIGGIWFTHAPILANGKPVSGSNSLKRAMDIYNGSIVYGHTHRFQIAGQQRHDSPRLQQAMECGCFYEGVPLYAQGAQNNYWKGVVLIHQYDLGVFDPEPISIERLKYEYGNRVS